MTKNTIKIAASILAAQLLLGGSAQAAEAVVTAPEAVSVNTTDDASLNKLARIESVIPQGLEGYNAAEFYNQYGDFKNYLKPDLSSSERQQAQQYFSEMSQMYYFYRKEVYYKLEEYSSSTNSSQSSSSHNSCNSSCASMIKDYSNQVYKKEVQYTEVIEKYVEVKKVEEFKKVVDWRKNIHDNNQNYLGGYGQQDSNSHPNPQPNPCDTNCNPHPNPQPNPCHTNCGSGSASNASASHDYKSEYYKNYSFKYVKEETYKAFSEKIDQHQNQADLCNKLKDRLDSMYNSSSSEERKSVIKEFKQIVEEKLVEYSSTTDQSIMNEAFNTLNY